MAPHKETRSSVFVETLPYQRFRAFCDEVRNKHSLGLCYGRSGVGKTLSARHYANWDKVSSYQQYLSTSGVRLSEVLGSKVVYHTLAVKSNPDKLCDDLFTWRRHLREFLIEDLYRQEQVRIEELKAQEEKERQIWWANSQATPAMLEDITDRTLEAIREVRHQFLVKQKETTDPSELIIIDDCDQITMRTLRAAVAIFDDDNIGMVLIGTPGFEKRISRHRHIYSRIGFVHEFGPLSRAEVCHLLSGQWWPTKTPPPKAGRLEEASLAEIMVATGGNFRLLRRLLHMIGHVMETESRKKVTRKVVVGASEKLVMVT